MTCRCIAAGNWNGFAEYIVNNRVWCKIQQYLATLDKTSGVLAAVPCLNRPSATVLDAPKTASTCQTLSIIS